VLKVASGLKIEGRSFIMRTFIRLRPSRMQCHLAAAYIVKSEIVRFYSEVREFGLFHSVVFSRQDTDRGRQLIIEV
jgi:hypothetical protein